jgi:hypothetical protein
VLTGVVLDELVGAGVCTNILESQEWSSGNKAQMRNDTRWIK